MQQKIPFKNRILFLGCGAVAQCTLALLEKHIVFDPKNITIIDTNDYQKAIKPFIQMGMHYQQQEITQENYSRILDQEVNSGDIIIDLTYNVSTADLLAYCNKNNIRYINTAVYGWENEKKSYAEATLCALHGKIKQIVKQFDSSAPTMIVEHGANPGLVSHFAKKALEDMSLTLLEQKPHQSLDKALIDKNFPALARLLDINVIHVTERDTQIINNPKRVNEFVNTWSVTGLYEEAVGPAEFGWGTHETWLPATAKTIHKHANQIYLEKPGMDLQARSWVPHGGNFIGMLIPHEEIVTISDYFTIYENNQVSYRPSVYFVYLPSDAAVNSLHEVKMNDYKLYGQKRVVKAEIIDGEDQVGALLMGPQGSWWTGSALSIHQVRSIVPHENATTLPVAAGVLSSLVWAINNPQEGYRLPDELPYEEILAIARPYLGTFISQEAHFQPPAADGHQPTWELKTFLV